MTSPIRVVIVDDHHLVRSGLRAMLDVHDDVDVVGEAGDGAAALSVARTLSPDVVVMDIRMPRMDGIEATRRLRQDAAGGPQVLVLTTFDLDEYVYEALRAGAGGFLLKDAPPDRLADAVRTVAAGEALLAPAVTRRLVEQYVRRPTRVDDPRLVRLTDREREVTLLVARGLSNTEIAGRLYLSEATVKTHVTRLLTKLELRDRVQVVVFAYERGLVEPGDAET